MNDQLRLGRLPQLIATIMKHDETTRSIIKWFTLNEECQSVSFYPCPQFSPNVDNHTINRAHNSNVNLKSKV